MRGLTRNDLASYELLSRAGSDIKGGMLAHGLARAADVTPEQIDRTSLKDTTPNTDGMVYDSDTGQYLPKYIDAKGQSTEQAVTQQNTPADGESEAPVGMSPTFSATTTTQHRLGNKTQDAPFLPEQVDAQRLRNQADVYTRFGLADKAMALQGMAKGREDEGVTNQIRLSAMDGMKNTKDMRDDEKQFAMDKNMHDAAVRLGRPDIAAPLYERMQRSQAALLGNAWDRAERVRRATISPTLPNGSIAGFIDVQNKYVNNGITIPEYKENADGSYWLKLKDEWTGKEFETTVPKDKIGDYLLQMRDIKKVQEIEQARAKSVFDMNLKMQEEAGKIQKVGKDETIVNLHTGKSWSNPNAGQFNVKDANPVLDDSRKLLSQMNGNARVGMAGQVEWTEKGKKAVLLTGPVLKGTPGLTADEVAAIIDGGVLVEKTQRDSITGHTRVIQGINYKGTNYPIVVSGSGEINTSAAAPAAPTVSAPGMSPAQALSNTKQVAPREVRGKISGMERTQTPADFPRMSQEQQSAADVEAGKILVQEAGSLQKAQADLAIIDAELKNPKLDGTQRGILRGHRNRLAAGIAAMS